MAITIGSSNISSLQAQKSLSDATSKVAKAYERLSSGLRINQASDDAAGLAIATGLDSKARVYTVGVRNVNDAISASTIAEGALNSLKDISQRQLELAEQAANGTYSTKQRSALNKEANALVDEYNRIVSSTTFNGLSLFDPKLGSVLIQAGNSTLQEGFSDSLSRSVGDGTFQNQVRYNAVTNDTTAVVLGDVNGDGKLDAITSGYSGHVAVNFGNGDGTFKPGQSFSTAGTATNTLLVGDVNGDGKLDIVAEDYASHDVSILLGNGDGSFAAAKSVSTLGGYPNAISLADFNGDGRPEIVLGNHSTNTVTVLSNNGDGTFSAAKTYALPGTSNLVSLKTGDFNGDGNTDIVTLDYGDGYFYSSHSGGFSILFGNGDSTFQSAKSTAVPGRGILAIGIGDLDGDGNLDIVTTDQYGTNSIFFGNGDGSFKDVKTFALLGAGSAITVKDFNGDGHADLFIGETNYIQYSVLLGNGDGTFQAEKTSFAPASQTFVFGDLNGDGRLDAVGGSGYYGSNQLLVHLGNGSYTSTEQFLNLNTRAGALGAQTVINGNLDRIENQLGTLGASGSRFQTALNNLQVQSENFAAAASRIQDADIARESSVLVRTQILQQAAASVLAQANQQPALALKLLNG